MQSPTNKLKEAVNHNPFSESGTSPPVHTAAELFPMMSDKELDGLAVDIQTNGQQEPIWIHPKTGEILDGRNRLKACQLAGVEPKYQTWNGIGSVIDFIVSKNIHRRHLDNHQRSVIAANLSPLFEAEAQKRQQSGKSSEEKGEATAKAAAVMNVSQRGVERVKRARVKGSPMLNAALDIGVVSIAEAEQIASLSPQQQDEVVLASDKKDRQKKLVEIKCNKTPNKTDGDRLNESASDLRNAIRRLGKDLNTLSEDEARCLEQELKALRDVVVKKLKMVESVTIAPPVEGGKND